MTATSASRARSLGSSTSCAAAVWRDSAQRMMTRSKPVALFLSDDPHLDHAKSLVNIQATSFDFCTERVSLG